MPTLPLRHLSPLTSPEAPAGLVDNVKDILRPTTDENDTQELRHGLHYLTGLLCISLGVAGLVATSPDPRKAASRPPRA